MSDAIIILDIDGVLNGYPACWVDYVNSVLNTDFEDLYAVKEYLPYASYTRLKKVYRSCGVKRTLPVNPEAPLFAKALKDNGYFIHLVTSRPFERFENLKEDTVFWLTQNNIPYDSLRSSYKKPWEIHWSPSAIVVEDNRFFANEFAKRGHTVFLLDNKYNQGKLVLGVQRVSSLSEILRRLNINAKCNLGQVGSENKSAEGIVG